MRMFFLVFQLHGYRLHPPREEREQPFERLLKLPRQIGYARHVIH
jgi:hypothetical protein